MKAGLGEINLIPGVWGSLLCTNQGELIENLTPPGLNKSTLENISRHMVELLSGTVDSIPGLGEVVLHYQDRKVFAVDLERAVLIVVCTPSVDISLLRLNINVVLTRWEDDPGVQKRLRERFVERI